MTHVTSFRLERSLLLATALFSEVDGPQFKERRVVDINMGDGEGRRVNNPDGALVQESVKRRRARHRRGLGFWSR